MKWIIYKINNTSKASIMLCTFCCLIFTTLETQACHYFGARNLTFTPTGPNTMDIDFQYYYVGGQSCASYWEVQVIETGCTSIEAPAYFAFGSFAGTNGPNLGGNFYQAPSIEDVPICAGKQYDIVFWIRRFGDRGTNLGNPPSAFVLCDDRNSVVIAGTITHCANGACTGQPGGTGFYYNTTPPTGNLLAPSSGCNDVAVDNEGENWGQIITNTGIIPGLIAYEFELDYNGDYLTTMGNNTQTCSNGLGTWISDDETDDLFEGGNQVGPAGANQINNGNIGSNNDFAGGLNLDEGIQDDNAITSGNESALLFGTSVLGFENDDGRDVIQVACGQNIDLDYFLESCSNGGDGPYSTLNLTVVQRTECGTSTTTIIDGDSGDAPPENPQNDYFFDGTYNVGIVSSLETNNCLLCDGTATGYVDVDFCIDNQACQANAQIDHCYRVRFIPVISDAGNLTMVGEEGNGCAELDPLNPEPSLGPLDSGDFGALGVYPHNYPNYLSPNTPAIATDPTDQGIVNDQFICADDQFQLRFSDWHLRGCSDNLGFGWGLSPSFITPGNDLGLVGGLAESSPFEADNGTPNTDIGGLNGPDPTDDRLVDHLLVNNGAFPRCTPVYFKSFTGNAIGYGGIECTSSCYDESNEIGLVFLDPIVITDVRYDDCDYNSLHVNLVGGAPECTLVGGNYTIELLDETGNVFSNNPAATIPGAEVFSIDATGNVINGGPSGTVNIRQTSNYATASSSSGFSFTNLPEGCYTVRVSDAQSCGWKYWNTPVCVFNPLIGAIIPPVGCPTINEVNVVVFGGSLTFGTMPNLPYCGVSCVGVTNVIKATSSVNGPITPTTAFVTGSPAPSYQYTFANLSAGQHQIEIEDGENVGCPIILSGVEIFAPLEIAYEPDPCAYNQITIANAIGGKDPKETVGGGYNFTGITTTPGDGTTLGNGIYNLFLDDDNDITNGFLDQADASAVPFVPITFGAGNIGDLAFGNYWVHLQDANGCLETIMMSVGDPPIPDFNCPPAILPLCEGTFSCNFQDLNPNTAGLSVGSISGTAAPYLQGDINPGGTGVFDPTTMPTGVPLTLQYTLTLGVCFETTIICTFTVEEPNPASAGGF